MGERDDGGVDVGLGGGAGYDDSLWQPPRAGERERGRGEICAI